MSVVSGGHVRCDLCQTVVRDTQAYPMAAGDRYEHICHMCVLDGWVSFCSGCWHSCPPSRLDVNNKCEACRGTDGNQDA